MSDNTKAVVFAAVLSLVCCILITAACTGLQKYQRINAELDRQINIIRSVGLVEEGKAYTKEEVNRLYQDHIVNAWALTDGTLLTEKPAEGIKAIPLYLDKEKGALGAYIIPLDMRGLWGRIYGYLALQSDGKTVEGFTVYKHSETPGLGGEIENTWFRKDFSGKQIVNKDNQFVSVSVAKGPASDSVPDDKRQNYVDGISGATLTGRYLTQGLKETLEKFEPLSQKLRQGEAKDIRL